MHAVRLAPRELAAGAVVAGAGAVALVAVYFTEPGTRSIIPSCPMKAITGLWCPGCGSTRALHSLLHGDVASAFTYNPLFLFAFGVVLVLSVLWVRQRFFTADHEPRFELSANMRWTLLAVIVAFGVLRNIPFDPFTVLAPHPYGQ